MPSTRPGRLLARATAGAGVLVLALGGVAHAAPDRLTPAGAAGFDPLPGVAVGPIGDYVKDIAIAKGGTRALVVSDDYLAQLDVSAPQPRVTGRTSAVRGTDVAYHPSGTTAYVVDDEQLIVVDTTGAAPRPVRALQGVVPNSATAIAVSRDGRWAYIAYGSGFGGGFGVRVLSLTTPRAPVKKGTIATDPDPVDVDVSPDGKRLVTTHGLDDYVGLFDVSTPTAPKTVAKHFRVPFAPGAAAFSPDGATVYLWGEDDAKVGTLDWQRRLVTRTKSLGNADGGNDVVVSPDGRYLYGVLEQASDGTGAVVVDTRTLGNAALFTGLAYSRGLATSPGGPSAGRTYFLSSGSTTYDERSHVYPIQR